jgi:phage tail sheath protein FI
MANHSSAGVYVREIDLSQRVAAASSSIAAIVGESAKGPVGERTLITSTKQFLATFGKPNAALSFMHYCALAFLEHGNRLYVTRVAPNALYGGAIVSIENSLNKSDSFTAGMTDPTIYEFKPEELFVVYGANQGTWTSDLKVYIYPNTKVADGTFYVDVYQNGINRALESFLVHLDFKVDGYGVQLNIEEHINKRSSLIRIKQNYEHSGLMANPKHQFVNALNVVSLAGGTNGTKATHSDIANAWDLYADPEHIDVNMLINGGYTVPAIQRKMTAICEDRMDCIAILDTPALSQKVSDAIAYRRNTLMADSSYAALYAPDYLILDEYNDLRLYVPPSGHIAGAYARTDEEFELWFAPAGMNRGRLNVLGVRHVYNQGDRDMLVDNQVNPTRVIQGAGIKIWGADTLQTMASALSNVSVRRLMMFLEKSLSRAALYSVFDPNDPVLQAQLTELATRFLKPIKDARGMYSFGVICDSSNNLPETIANGDLIMDVYIDPVLPAKRIHLTAIIQKTGARFVAGNSN